MMYVTGESLRSGVVLSGRERKGGAARGFMGGRPGEMARLCRPEDCENIASILTSWALSSHHPDI